MYHAISPNGSFREELADVLDKRAELDHLVGMEGRGCNSLSVIVGVKNWSKLRVKRGSSSFSYDKMLVSSACRKLDSLTPLALAQQHLAIIRTSGGGISPVLTNARHSSK